MIAIHKRNFPLHHCMVPAKNFVGRGDKPKKPPPPPWTWRKVAKKWQKGRHMNKMAPYKEKNVDFFPMGGGAMAYSAPPFWRPCLYYLNNHIHFLKRTFSENIFQDAPNCTINKHSGVCSNTPKCSAQ